MDNGSRPSSRNQSMKREQKCFGRALVIAHVQSSMENFSLEFLTYVYWTSEIQSSDSKRWRLLDSVSWKRRHNLHGN
ncbi:hypothetical protein TNCV_846561 [Trichonephila clavipes]|nr:hypothetical protein TNCV_846561 [Trichonephila clavipes]